MMSKTTKSPSSPSRPLGSCFEDAKKLFDSFPNTSFDQMQIANRLGMSSKSGSFASLLSDLKQYGLIEKDSSGAFVVAGIIKEFDISDDSAKAQIKYQLATHPKLFLQILENQGYHLPDTATLSNVLIARFGFGKARSVKVAKALRESLEWAGSIDAKGNIIKPSSTVKEIDNYDLTGSAESAGLTSNLSSISAPSCNGGLLTVEVSISDGNLVRIQYPSALTSNDAEKVSAVLTALAK